MKINEVIGHQVIALDSGKVIGEVSEVLIRPDLDRLIGLVLEDRAGFQKIILFKDIVRIGDSAVIINSELSVFSEKNFPLKKEKYLNRASIRRLQVMTDEGNSLGRLVNSTFNKDNGNVTSLEVSQGPVEDLRQGRRQIGVEEIIKVGEEIIIVRPNKDE